MRGKKGEGSSIYGARAVCQAPCWRCLHTAQKSAYHFPANDSACLPVWPVLSATVCESLSLLRCQVWGRIIVSSGHLLWHCLYLFGLQYSMCVLDKRPRHNPISHISHSYWKLTVLSKLLKLSY